MTRLTIGVGMLLLSGSALAGASANFTLEEYSFNTGGAPTQGQQPASANFKLTLASIGEALVVRGLSSGSFQLNAGFDTAYTPPGEVASTCGTSDECVAFSDAATLMWPAESSAGTYNLYRGPISNLVGLEYGSCEQQNLPGTMTTDDDPVPLNDGFFYLVTVENRLGEESTKGFRVDGMMMIERGGAVCP